MSTHDHTKMGISEIKDALQCGPWPAEKHAGEYARPGEYARLLAELVTCDEYIDRIAEAVFKRIHGKINADEIKYAGAITSSELKVENIKAADKPSNNQ